MAGHALGKFWWGRVRPFWHKVKWPALTVLALTAWILGYLGFGSYLDARGATASVWDRIYLSFQLFGLESGVVEPPVPAMLQVARLLAPLVAAFAAISALAAIFRDQIARTNIRWFARDHVVICDLGRTGLLLAKSFRARGYQVVAIERDPNHPAVNECREKGARVLIGDATEGSVLAAAQIDRARYVFAVSDDDGVNAQIAIEARERAGSARKPLTCYVQVVDVDLAEMLDLEMATRATRIFRLEIFNPAERGAPALLNEYPPFDAAGATKFGPPHILIIGLGQMGSRLLAHAARRWDEIVGSDGPRLRMSVVDRDADRHIELLTLRYPQLEKVCELTPHKLNVDDAEFERGDFLFDSEGRHVTSAYVALGNDALGLAAALRLQRRLRTPGIPIVVRTKQLGGLGTLLGSAAGEHADLQVFGLLDLVCRPEVLLEGRTEQLARAIHHEYVRNAAAKGDTPAVNPSMVDWDKLPEDLKETNRRHADDIGNKLRAIGCVVEPKSDWGPDSSSFSDQEIEFLARLEHERWMQDKLADGWSHGAQRHDGSLVHPCIVTWPQTTPQERIARFGAELAGRIGDDDLPEHEKEKDRELIRAIPTILSKAGLRAGRVDRPRAQGARVQGKQARHA